MYKLNPELRGFWRTRKPYKLLKGGRFSSKTQDAGGMAAYLARNYSVKFLCIRQFQNRIADSVYTVVKEKIETAGWRNEFDIGVSTIRHKTTGSEFLFYGIARNIDDIKGTEGVDVCWIEEGEGLTEAQWDIIDPTIRKSGSETWIVYNPRFATDFIVSKLPKILGDDCIIKHINYTSNPFLSDTARAKAERVKLTDPEKYEHIYLGVPLTNDEAVLIKREWIEAAIDAHKKLTIEPTGGKRIGFDVADSGADKNATVSAHGFHAYACDEWAAAEDEILVSCTRVHANAIATKSAIWYDSIGVGASAGNKFSELNQVRGTNIEYHKFNAGAGVLDPDHEYEHEVSNKDFFLNLKAQAWWIIAQRFRNTYNAIKHGERFRDTELISIASDLPNLERLITELSTPRKEYDQVGRVKVESKKDLAKRGVSSPNLADAFVMAFAPRSTSVDILMEAF
jgi:phage terminase large subunit